MRVSIRFKIIALGAILSIVATTAAIIFSGIEYRNRGKNDKLDYIDQWLTKVSEDFVSDEYPSPYCGEISAAKEYVKGIYDANIDTPLPTFSTFKEKKNYYANRYLWIYPFDSLSMRYITPEEREFRTLYQDIVSLLTDTFIFTDAKSVFIGYFDENLNRLVIIADNMAIKRNYYEEYHLPGDYIENYDNTFTPVGNSYEKIFPNEVTRAIPIPVSRDDLTTSSYLFVSYDFKAIDATADSLVISETIALSIISLALVAMYAVMSHLLVTRNINKLTEATSEFENTLINGQELQVKDPNISSRDEIKDLSNSVVSLEESVINYSSALARETKEKEKINAELSIASKIQLEALESCNYNDDNVEVDAYIRTAKEVGGDFYDYYYKDENHFIFVIADVSGKGVPASLFMMRAKEIIKFQVSTAPSLKQAAYNINNLLIDNNKEGLFVTAFIGVIDLKNHKMKFIDAGHERPYIISKDQVTQMELNTNFVFGGVKDFKYEESEIDFNSGDRLFLYTDGLNESINDNDEEFGYERILESLKKNPARHNKTIISDMEQDLVIFTNNKEAFDDTTIVMVELKEKNNSLTLKYNNPQYDSIEEITNKFNAKFDYLEDNIRYEVGVIIDEMMNNYINYERRKSLFVYVNFSIKDEYLEITFTNNGVKFNPLEIEDKYFEKGEKDLTMGGFGITIVKSLSSNVKYLRFNHLNYLTIIKKIS